MRWGTQDSVQKVFNRCLNHNVPHLPLWTHYLRYIRGIHGLPEGPLDQIPIDDHKLNSVISAYEFALDHVGLDIGAGELWMDYIELLDRKKVKPIVSISLSRFSSLVLFSSFSWSTHSPLMLLQERYLHLPTPSTQPICNTLLT